MLCSILDGNSRINPEHQLSGLNQKTPKRTFFSPPFFHRRTLLWNFLRELMRSALVSFSSAPSGTWKWVMRYLKTGSKSSPFSSDSEEELWSGDSSFSEPESRCSVEENLRLGGMVGVDPTKISVTNKSREVPYIVIVYRII